MHACLLLPEITSHIITELAKIRPRKISLEENLTDVAALAITCRALLEPSLDVIWRQQIDLDNLIKTLPADAWRVDGERFSLSRPLTHSDWDRFDYYAPRIKHIEFRGKGKQWTSDVLVALSLHQNAIPGQLLPSLQTLISFIIVKESSLRQSYICLRRTLTFIAFVFAMSDESSRSLSRSLFSHIPHTSPNIEQIRYHGPSLPFAVLEPILSCTHLRDIRCRLSFTIGVEQFALLPRLEILKITTDPSAKLTSHPPPSHFPLVFQSLTSLAMGGASTLQLVQWCEFPVLRTLKIRESDMRLLHLTLKALYDLDVPGLSGLTVHGPRGDDLFNASDIQPILKFRNLTSFSTGLSFSSGEHVVEQMAKAWPRLAMLVFQRAKPWFPLAGLLPLVQYCPELNRITIPLADCTPPLSQDGKRGQFSNPHISRLTVLTSEVDNPVEVAEFLSDVFPNLRKITTSSSVSQEHEWRIVEENLSVIAANRA